MFNMVDRREVLDFFEVCIFLVWSVWKFFGIWDFRIVEKVFKILLINFYF